jgi:hypothetical protein
VNWLNFFIYLSKKKNNFEFCDICGYKKGGTTNFSPSFVAVIGSGNRDPDG